MIDELTSGITKVVLAVGVISVVVGLARANSVDPTGQISLGVLCWIAWSIDRVRLAIERRSRSG